MGKASRKKKDKPLDVATLYHQGICTRCGKQPRTATHMWCPKCIDNARRYRDTRQRRVTKSELLSALDALEAELMGDTHDTTDTTSHDDLEPGDPEAAQP